MERHGIGWGARVLSCLSILLATTTFATAGDPPDAALNPVSGAIEVTDAVLSGSDLDIRYVVKPPDGGATTTAVLTDSTASDLDPRIDIKPSGNTWIVWWRDAETPEVLYRVKNYETGSWASEARVSAEGEAASHPTIVHDESTTWVAYQGQTSSGISIKCSHTDDGPEPIPDATVIATTTFSGNPDALIQSESGHIWASWVDSTTAVTWSELDKGTGEWSTPQAESYEGSTVKAARDAIRSAILAK